MSKTTNTDELNNLVQELFEALREGQIVEIGTSPLADSSLVNTCLLSEDVSVGTRAQILQANLRWAIDELRPGGAHNWHSRSWLNFNVLDAYYWQGHRLADVAEWLGYSDIHLIRSLRPKAVATVTQLLQKEMLSLNHTSERQYYVAAALYEQLSTTAQQLLHLIGCFDTPLHLEFVYQLFDAKDVPAALNLLEQSTLVTLDENRRVAATQTFVKKFVQTQILPKERQDWYRQAARYYENTTPLRASKLYYQAGDLVKSVNILFATWEDILRGGDSTAIQKLQNRLALFSVSELPSDEWYELQKVKGQIAEFSGDLAAAQAAYESSVASSLVETKSFVLYRLAELAKKQHNVDMALAYYQRCITLLQGIQEKRSALAGIHIDRAMIFVQEKQMLEQAREDLQEAEELVSEKDFALLSRLHNGWGAYYYRRQELEVQLEHRLQAWLNALESNDPELKMIMAHNLGQAYVWQKNPSEGLPYLEISLKLATQSGNQHLMGTNYKTIGNAYFLSQNMEQAKTNYHQAYDIFVEMNNTNWQGYMCHELAELYAATGDWESAKHFLNEGRSLAYRLGNFMLIDVLTKLTQEFSFLEAVLNERQQACISYLSEHEKITNREYCEIANCSSVTAARDLNELVEQDVIIRHGSGRGTYYTLSLNQ